MRRLDLTLTALLIPLDVTAMLAAAATAHALRFSNVLPGLPPALQTVPLGQYMTTATLLSFFGLILLALAGLYSLQPRGSWHDLGRIILAVTAGVMVIITDLFFRREFTTSRFLVLAIWPLTILYVWFGRLSLRLLRTSLLGIGFGRLRLAIIGQNKTASDLRQLYKRRPSLGYQVVKSIKVWNKNSQQELEQLRHAGHLDAILLAEPAISKEQALDIIMFAESHNLGFRYLADLFSARFHNIEMSAPGGIPIIEIKRTPLDGWGRIAKRAFDIVASGILIVIFSPVMLAAAIAIKLTSEGPVFYQLDDDGPPQRIGEGGKPFHYLKFRSMFRRMHMQRYKELAHLDLRKDGPLVKIKNDPRITAIGRFIRKWSIDELPELLLVFIGRMSLVGPRPHEPEEVARYKPHHRRVLDIKPGITGMAQISGRSNLAFEDEINLDTWYIENWSPWLDVSILLRTPLAVLNHRGVEEGV